MNGIFVNNIPLAEYMAKQREEEVKNDVDLAIQKDIITYTKMRPKIYPRTQPETKPKKTYCRILTPAEIRKEYADPMEKPPTSLKYKILEAIYQESQPVSAADIARRLGKPMAHVTAMLSQLSTSLPNAIERLETRPLQYKAKDVTTPLPIVYKEAVRTHTNRMRIATSVTSKVGKTEKVPEINGHLEKFIVKSWLNGVDPRELETLAKGILRRKYHT